MKTHLFFGLLTLVLLTIIIGTRRREAFGFDDVIDLAQAIAAGRSLSAAPALPKELKELNYDQHRDIRWKDQYTLWRREGLPFQVRFVHPGYIFDRPVDIFYEVSNSSFERLRYSPVFFDFGRNVFRARFPDTHVKAVIFFRKKVEHAGYAPITSMYWFGENTSNTFGDFRPEVHDSDGLLVHRNNGEWVWHPLAWSKQLQLNVFADDHPKGYGLLQRDRDFNHYQDLEALYHKRPSVWVQALNGFDNGAARLVQLPTKDEFQDNVVAFWTPAEPPPLLKPIELEYMLRWFGDSEDLPPLGRCVLTRVDDQDKPYYRRPDAGRSHEHFHSCHAVERAACDRRVSMYGLLILRKVVTKRGLQI
jgi:glucan biosynthesis protein